MPPHNRTSKTDSRHPNCQTARTQDGRPEAVAPASPTSNPAGVHALGQVRRWP